MTEVEDWIEDVFADRVEGEDLTLEDIQDWYETKLEEYGGHDAAARSAVQGQYNEWVNTGADGEVKLVTIGHDGPRPFGDNDMLFGYAIAIPEDDPAKPAVIMFDETDVDHDAILPYFQEPYSAVKGEFGIRNASRVSDAYILEAVQGTTLEEFEPEKDRDGRKEMVDDFVIDAEIASIGDYLALTDDNGYPADYGADLRKIPGAYVLEARVGENGARYEVQDNSFVDARDLDDSVRGDDNARGLVCWVDPAVATFGEGSIVDLYGVITAGQNTGQVTMNVVGVDPIQAQELDNGGGGDSEESARSGGDSSGAAEERTI